ncbi:MAG: hypothetical protein J5I50_12105 [Chitinophagaceae bacterium]|nr:hypothetical protein [Chitinophagaceae bacterium]
MKSITGLILILLLSAVALTGCEKDKIACSDDRAFCALVQQENYDDLVPIINKFLKKQNRNLTDTQQLNQLKDWLECKSCVSYVELLCNSCVYTLPPQSELLVRFSVNGQQVDKVLDVIMDKPLRIREFHQ